MKIHLHEQGSGEWYKARLGIPTASNFHKILTPGGKPSAQAREYMYRLIAERLLMDTMDSQIGQIEWVERGKEEEPNAVRQFQFTSGLQLANVGFVTNDSGTIGCTPDRLVQGLNHAVEIKCPSPWVQMGYLLDGPGDHYKPQVQGQLLVGDFDAVHFYAYHPRMPAAHVLTHRDEVYVRNLGAALQAFLEVLQEQTERARRLGAYVATQWPTLPLEQQYPDGGEDPLQIILPP